MKNHLYNGLLPQAMVLLVLLLVVTSTAKAAVGGGGANTTTYTTSTNTISIRSDTTVNKTVNDSSVQLIGLFEGKALYDQTFDVAFSDPSVLAAVLVAQNTLLTAGAASFIGPTQTSSLSTQNTVSYTDPGVETEPVVTFATTSYIGPQTIMVGDNQSQAFTIVAGGIDYDTLVTTTLYKLYTTTITDTYLTTQIYNIVGYAVDTPNAPVPEPSTILLFGAGLVGLVGLRRKNKR